MKNLFVITIILISFYSCVNNTKETSKLKLPIPLNELQDEWQRVNINGIVSIDLPPEMEIQGEEFKAITKELRSIHGNKYNIEFSESELIFQPLGVNAGDVESLGKYARVMYEASEGNPGDYQKLTERIVLSNMELIELNKELKMQFTENFKRTPIQITEWYPIQIIEINGMSALLISYKRQLGDKPYVHVKGYQFFDDDKIHSLTLSYRITEKELWEHNLNLILKSFRITKYK